jgi:hypothetical protein
MADLKVPATKQLAGILVNTAVLDGGVVLLTVESKDGKSETVATSENYWNKVGKSFQTEKPVNITVEVRKAGETGYAADPKKPKELTAHTRDGLNLTNITVMSQYSWEKMDREETKHSDVQIILSNDPAYAQALAAYLAGKK